MTFKKRIAPAHSRTSASTRGHCETTHNNRVPSFIKVRIVVHKSHITECKEAQDTILIHKISDTVPEVNIFKLQAVV